MGFALVRRYQDLVAAPGFAGHSADLQAIELKRTVVPLMEQVAREGFAVQEFAVAEESLSAVKILGGDSADRGSPASLVALARTSFAAHLGD